MDWKNLPDAPRDRPVLLFLPKMELENGKPTGRSLDDYAVGRWDDRNRRWVVNLFGGGEHAVYPSLWTDIEPYKQVADGPAAA